jgi:ubiquitin carboxyl-terminal hydrolase 36/42
MNAVLQCLTHTPPLAEALLSRAGAALAARGGDTGAFDALRATRAHVARALADGRRPPAVAPTKHAQNLRKVCRR